MDSLNRSDHPERASITNNSNLCEGFEYVLEGPGVLQPPGHTCGMACNINQALTLRLDTYEAIPREGVSSVLEHFELPARNERSSADFATVTEVFIDMYVRGSEGIPSPDVLLTEVSARVKEARGRLDYQRQKNCSRMEKKETIQREKTGLTLFCKAKKTWGLDRNSMYI